MSGAKPYSGGCHCGAVRYEVTVSLEGLRTCDCSICLRTGAIMAFAPAERFKLLAGETALRDYQFGKKRIHHLFGSICGVRSFASGKGPDGKEMVMINARCLDDVDAVTLPNSRYNGRSL